MHKRVLIADDSKLMRRILARILSSAGYAVAAEAKNGVEAVSLYQKFKPDIVTMDIVMPGLDGLQALKVIKALDPNARVVMVSSIGQQDVIMEAIRAGAKDFLIKPFRRSQVVKTFTRIFNSLN
jgi:two-component system chemotaxis response regulator CheY